MVGTVGRLAVEKNQALLLSAVAPLLGDRTRLLVAGDGPLLPALSARAAALGVAPFVHLLGARRDVPDLLNALDAFALSSDSEGLPLVIPEAMATGLPVVSTQVGGVPDVLEEGLTGFMVPAGDEAGLRSRIAALRADLALGRACGARARAVALAASPPGGCFATTSSSTAGSSRGDLTDGPGPVRPTASAPRRGGHLVDDEARLPRGRPRDGVDVGDLDRGVLAEVLAEDAIELLLLDLRPVVGRAHDPDGDLARLTLDDLELLDAADHPEGMGCR